jgi:hypothetical protein
MNKFGIPVFEATIDNLDEGIMAISLVDSPAVESNFLVFKEEKQSLVQKYSIQDEDQHIITGVVMRANWPIYRYDENFGEYYIFYSPETIKIMAEKMIKDNTQNEVNIMHDDGNFVEGVNLVELFIKDSSKGISPAGFEDIEEGSLFATYKINNDEIWKEIKAGAFRGLSLQGYFSIEPSNKLDFSMSKNTITSNMAKLFNKFMKSFVKCGNIKTDKGELYWVGEADLQIGDELFYDRGEEIIKVEDGEYTIEDGTVIVVKEGLVSEIREKDGEQEGELDMGKNKKMGKDKKSGCFEEEVIVEEPTDEKPETESYEDLKRDIDDLRKEHDELKGMYEDLKATVDAILSKPAAEPIVEEFKKVVKTETNAIPAFGSRSKTFKK